MVTIDDLIRMKRETNNVFGTRYKWLIKRIEDDLISKLDGDERVKDLLSDYDYNAKLFIVHQFFNKVYDELGNKLFGLLEIDKDNMFLADKYVNELEK